MFVNFLIYMATVLARVMIEDILPFILEINRENIMLWLTSS